MNPLLAATRNSTLIRVRPAGQGADDATLATATPAPTDATPLEPAPLEVTVAPPAPDPNAIDYDASGRLVGVDGVLDQVAEALRRQAEPMLRETVLPVLTRDRAMQRELGTGAGEALAKKLEPWVILGSASLGVMAVVQMARLWRHYRRDRAARRRGAR